MNQARKRLTYANVMSTIAVFLVLGGATAFAVSNALPKKSVGSKQLKANAVTTAKIKKNAVTKKKIKDGAVDAAKVADGSLTGTEINAASTPFSRVVAKIRNAATVPFAGKAPYTLGAYTQSAGEDDQFLGGVDVNFGAGCTAPREAAAYLLLDAPDPAKPTLSDVVGLALVEDKGAGAVTRRIEFSPFSEGGSPMSRMAPAAAVNHTFSIYFANAECSAGNGVSLSNAGVDVIGTKQG